MITIRTFRGRDGLEAIAPEWATVAAGLRARRFFHEREWFRCMLAALEPRPEAVHFFVAYRDGVPLAVVPLRAARRRVGGVPLRLLESPNHPHLPLFDVLCRAEVSCAAVVGELVRFLRRAGSPGWDALRLRNVPEDSTLFDLPDGGPDSWRRELTATADFFDCTEGYDAISARFSKNFRANLRKARNRLVEHPDAEFRCVCDPAQLPEAFRAFLDLEASGWKGSHGTASAIALDPGLVRFYEALIAQFAPAGRCRINLLRVAGAAIAAEFCLLDEDTLYVLKIAHDESHARLSPGNLLLEWALRSAAGEPAIRFVSLVTDTAWHADWRPRRRRLGRFTLCNRTLRGMVLGVGLRVRTLLGRGRGAGRASGNLAPVPRSQG